MDIQFKDVYGDYVDLFSAFINAMEGMVAEVFKRNALEGLDLGDMVVELRRDPSWHLVVLCDKNVEENHPAIQHIENTIKSHRTTIHRYMDKSIVVRPSELVRAEVVDIISGMAVSSPDETVIINTNEKLAELIRLRHNINLATQKGIVSTKIELMKMLEEDPNDYETLLLDIIEQMETEKSEAQKWLALLKNAIYDEYMRTMDVREINWANIFYYFINFSSSLAKITKNEVVKKHLGVVSDILNSVTGQPYEALVELIGDMDDRIESYIDF
jgi:hypothetical protein